MSRRKFLRRPSFSYLAGLLAVSAAMLMLPLSYLALLGCLVWTVIRHLGAHASWLMGPHAGPLSAALYFIAAAFPAVLAAFLLQPLFSIAEKRKSDLALDPAAEPHLHVFVGQICRALGAPEPLRIQVNMEVNASARFAAGKTNLLMGGLELTLGLPLVRGLDLGQFAAVLAHELGHFRQGAAMRLVHGLRALNQWFARAAEDKEIPLGFAFSGGWLEPLFLPARPIARICGVAARAILGAHMRAGAGISCLLLRQMERQADTAAIRMVGGETFASMVLEAKILESAWGLANRSLGLALREGRLADDLPALVAAHTRVFIPEVRRKIEQALLQERTRWFDTHPSPAERVRRARAAPARGTFRAPGPAHALFADFPDLSRKATRAFYRQDLGEDFNPARMVSTAELISGHSDSQVGEAAVAGYFLGLSGGLRPFSLDPARLQGPEGPGDLMESLARARARVAAAWPSAAGLHRAFAAADARLVDAVQAKALLGAGFLIEPDDFQIEKAAMHHAEEARRKAETECRAASLALAEFEDAMRARLAVGLRLLASLEAAERLPDAGIRAREVTVLLPVLFALGTAHPALESLRVSYHALGALLENLAGNESEPALEAQMRAHAAAVRRGLVALREALQSHPHPFSPSSAGLSVASYALEKLPGEDDYAGLHAAAEDMLDRCHALNGRILGRLALAAGRVEGALGLGPLETAVDFTSTFPS
jgi:Zn-dependent protease with chaperone function